MADCRRAGRRCLLAGRLISSKGATAAAALERELAGGGAVDKFRGSLTNFGREPVARRATLLLAAHSGLIIEFGLCVLNYVARPGDGTRSLFSFGV